MDVHEQPQGSQSPELTPEVAGTTPKSDPFDALDDLLQGTSYHTDLDSVYDDLTNPTGDFKLEKFLDEYDVSQVKTEGNLEQKGESPKMSKASAEDTSISSAQSEKERTVSGALGRTALRTVALAAILPSLTLAAAPLVPVLAFLSDSAGKEKTDKILGKLDTKFKAEVKNAGEDVKKLYETMLTTTCKCFKDIVRSLPKRSRENEPSPVNITMQSVPQGEQKAKVISNAELFEKSKNKISDYKKLMSKLNAASNEDFSFRKGFVLKDLNDERGRIKLFSNRGIGDEKSKEFVKKREMEVVTKLIEFLKNPDDETLNEVNTAIAKYEDELEMMLNGRPIPKTEEPEVAQSQEHQNVKASEEAPLQETSISSSEVEEKPIAPTTLKPLMESNERLSKYQAFLDSLERVKNEKNEDIANVIADGFFSGLYDAEGQNIRDHKLGEFSSEEVQKAVESGERTILQRLNRACAAVQAIKPEDWGGDEMNKVFEDAQKACTDYRAKLQEMIDQSK